MSFLGFLPCFVLLVIFKQGLLLNGLSDRGPNGLRKDKIQGEWLNYLAQRRRDFRELSSDSLGLFQVAEEWKLLDSAR